MVLAAAADGAAMAPPTVAAAAFALSLGRGVDGYVMSGMRQGPPKRKEEVFVEDDRGRSASREQREP